MKKLEPADLSAVEAVRLIAKGSLTSEALEHSCLERIVQREPEVQAFEHLARRAAHRFMPAIGPRATLRLLLWRAAQEPFWSARR